MNPAFHTIVVSILTGIFTASVIAVMLRLAVQNFKREWIDSVGKYADFAGWFFGAIGFITIFGALLTGVLIWPFEAVMNSPILKNKLFTAVLIIVFFGLFLYLRYRFKENLWQNRMLSIYYVLLSIGGYFWVVVTNSIGGDVAGNSSGFEYAVHLIGVDTRFTYYLPGWVLLLIVGSGVIAAVYPALIKKEKASAPSKQFNKVS